MLVPLICCVFWPKEAGEAWAFLLPAAVLLSVGALGWRWLRQARYQQLSIQDGGVIILLTWSAASLAGAVPFMGASTRLSFSHAVFECVSGLSTTGLTLVDVTRASHAILLWRSLLQLAGGAGLAILMVATLIGPSNPAVSAAEGRSQLVPHVRRSARLVLILYSGYVAIGIVGYLVVGLNPFDAVAHTFAAVATGGFSTYPDSIGHWDSAAVEALTLLLMVLGNLNFVTAWILIKGDFRAFFRNGEIRLLFILILSAGLLLLFVTTRGAYAGVSRACRVAVFESVSALTGTGFTMIDYTGWNPFGFLVITLLMLVGGGACSTSGALKQLRVYVLIKSVFWEVRKALLPSRAVVSSSMWEGDRAVEIGDARLRSISVYAFLYLTMWLLGALVLTAHGNGVGESLFEYASALGTVGLSRGITNPGAPGLVIWTETAGMFLGRLEFFVVFSGLTKLVRDAHRMLAR